MANTPWRRSTIPLEVDAGVVHTESATVPTAPISTEGTFWVRSDGPNVPMFTNGAGTDFVLNTGGGSVELGVAVQNTGATNPATMNATFAWRITDTQNLTFEATDGTDILAIAAAAGGDSVTFMAGSAAIAVTNNSILATGGALTIGSDNAGSDVNIQVASNGAGSSGDVVLLTGGSSGSNGLGGDIDVLTGGGNGTGRGGDWDVTLGAGGSTSGIGGGSTWTFGSGGGTGNGGSFVATLGDGGSGGGGGGSWNINTGAATFTGNSGGGYNVTLGASVGANGSAILMTAGGTNAGVGGAVQLTANNGTTGGGNFIVNSGNATVSGNGGIIFLQPGTGVDDHGYVDINPDWDTDANHYLELSASGTNTSNATQFFTGNRDPNTFVSGLPGSLYLRGNGASSTLYTNTTTGVVPGTTWTEVGGAALSAWQEVNTQTTGTGAGSETFTLATPLAAVPVDSQNFVHFRIIGEDTTSPGTHTFFTRELKTYYRGTGVLTDWTSEIVGAEQNRGFGSEITSVNLVVSGNAVIVQLTMASSTRTIDWCVQYLTKDTVGAASSGTSSTAGQVLTFDNRGAPLTTGSAAASGGTVDFSFDVGATYGEMKYLRVVTATGTCADATVRFYRDSGRTDEIYEAANKDTGTGNGWVDRNPATMMGDDGSALASNTMYGRITNNDAGAATFDVELVFWSDGTVPGASGALDFTGTKVTTYTAVAGEHVKYDPSGGTFTISMPSSASTNARVALKNASTSTTAITLSGNGNNVEDPASPGGGAASVSVSGAGVSLLYQYDGTQWWIV